MGALKGLAEILPTSNTHPFSIICGTSAGAVNAAMLAAHQGTFHEAVADLERLWQSLTPADVYRHGWFEISRSGLRILLSMLNHGVGVGRPLSLLDNSPLRELIREHITFRQIDRNIRRGTLDAVSITAMSYGTGESVCFFQTSPETESWQRPRRMGRRTLLNSDHILASSAIPSLFPATKLEHDYYGDGAMRQLSPLRPGRKYRAYGADQSFAGAASPGRARGPGPGTAPGGQPSGFAEPAPG